MDPKKPNEGNQQDEGDEDANSKSSESKGQPLEADFAETIAKLQRTVDAQQGEINALKSGKDKAVDRVEKSNKETLAKFAKYLNVDDTQLQEAERQAAIDDLIAERTGKSQSKQSISGKVDGKDNTAELQVIDKEFGLPENDSRVTDLKLKHSSDFAAYVREARKLADQLAEQKEASPGEQLLPTGGAPTKDENPIKDIEDPKVLYRMAAQQIAKGQKTRRAT